LKNTWTATIITERAVQVKVFIVNIDSPRRTQFNIGQTIKEAAKARNLEPHEAARG
jgi:hypothetical protein